MDRNKFSMIAHRHHVFYNPLSEPKLARMLERMGLQTGAHVLDVGAGQGELALRTIERFGVKVTALELSEEITELGRTRAKGRAADGSLNYRVGDAQEAVMTIPEGSFDAALCVGSSHALGGRDAALRELLRLLKPGGMLLLGEGYWKMKPAAAYLEALGGAEESELTSHAGNVSAGEEAGFHPVWAAVTSEDEWDEYEWLYAKSIEDYALERPDDPDVPAMLERSRRWRSTYMTWGRDTLGFGMYLFRKPV
ncbi:SAM-dependent methyltransferase [Paenibacillus mucilaginosus]|uniref:Methyltransferase n=2 Tax=Paenibacillus mucilaginosus TaxID=61624 RepID=H6NJV9_9BACL|nr:class I SAM-dependent methyltransferase [Paenibacillus mucilaginosus]AEI41758.1 methyltransferase [Paenibacillus mucilaginosus KNP414]AFC30263.1 methyltransferase [Paenibacillus mucilaginosus 3016]MCG7214447.1 methyltransferase domain-containing protein [Paenibacillus mucilaginosus]WDM30731.1 class I SAM-dependent methyltransferase [Paenibacillus mucilaginosus]WFA18907.1 class I SAM-dependent methyltransferase [Paenibacillus mucilaginosus]